MTVKGRPCQSEIRKNILEILLFLNKGYGYQISKVYNEIFPKVSQRSVYYHLRKGVQLQELTLNKIELEEGNFSWGKQVEKTYYSLGKKATPKGLPRVKEYLDRYLNPQ